MRARRLVTYGPVRSVCGLVVLATLGIGLAGCGGSSKGSSTTHSLSTVISAPPGTAAYRDRVNKLCAAGNARLNVSDDTRQMAKIEAQVVAQVKAIAPPASIRAQVVQWLADAGQATAATAVMGRTKFTNLKAREARGEFLTHAHRAYAQAKRLGLASCAVVGSI